MNHQLRKERQRNIQLIHQLAASASRLEDLLDKVPEALCEPESCDYVGEVPNLMGELYSNYLRIAAIRKRPNPDILSDSVLNSLPNIRALQEEAEGTMEDLSDLFDAEGDFGESEEEDEGSEEGRQPTLHYRA